MKKEGCIEAVNQKEGKFGIKIDELWYNGFGKCAFKKGDWVVVNFDISADLKWNNISEISSSDHVEVKSEFVPASTLPVVVDDSDEFIVKKAIDLGARLIENLNFHDDEYDLKARIEVYKELMTDRRTRMIEEFKKKREGRS